ncbi:MAG TPA: ferritin-like domain-containing protein [Phototrophicaceae bacterium]|nr:ferritin-like domain-containing protein [Phototrophicaceae bacterium]
MAKLENLNDLLVEQLEDLYDAENQLTRALPKMAQAASSPDLKNAFNTHLTETKGHVQRLEQVFRTLGKKAERKTCKAMQGLIAEGDETIQENGDPEVKDAALIAAAQRVEHYEMAGYGSVRTFAQTLGLTDVANTLQQTLNEEGNADKKLTQIAEGHVNERAR